MELDAVHHGRNRKWRKRWVLYQRSTERRTLQPQRCRRDRIRRWRWGIQLVRRKGGRRDCNIPSIEEHYLRSTGRQLQHWLLPSHHLRVRPLYERQRPQRVHRLWDKRHERTHRVRLRGIQTGRCLHPLPERDVQRRGNCHSMHGLPNVRHRILPVSPLPPGLHRGRGRMHLQPRVLGKQQHLHRLPGRNLQHRHQRDHLPLRPVLRRHLQQPDRAHQLPGLRPLPTRLVWPDPGERRWPNITVTVPRI